MDLQLSNESNWHATKKKKGPIVNGFLLGCSDYSSKQQPNGKMASGEPPSTHNWNHGQNLKIHLNCFLNIINITHA